MSRSRAGAGAIARDAISEALALVAMSSPTTVAQISESPCSSVVGTRLTTSRAGWMRSRGSPPAMQWHNSAHGTRRPMMRRSRSAIAGLRVQIADRYYVVERAVERVAE
jgi:hypothetical protein